jgi:putative membrane protein
MDDAVGPAQEPPLPAGLSSNAMALQRTRMADERTVMAWTRTAVSLISFGFSIYKFADILESQAGRRSILGPQAYGSAMILTGLAALGAALLQHRAIFRRARAKGITLPVSLAAIVALAVTLLGIFGLGLVVFHL